MLVVLIIAGVILMITLTWFLLLIRRGRRDSFGARALAVIGVIAALASITAGVVYLVTG